MPTREQTARASTATDGAPAATVRLRLRCLVPPGHADGTTEFGLQDKAGALLPGQEEAGGARRYDFALRVAGYGPGDRPRWRGAYVHGTAAAPFLYLGLRLTTPGADPWQRRLKVTLALIGREEIERAIVTGAALEATMAGAGSGTVPLLGAGWTVLGGDHV